MKRDTVILGGGISGVTTGIVLQLLGYRTGILTRSRADRPSKPDDPRFASLYPSASVIPHSVYGPEVPKLFDESQIMFELLLAEQFPGVSLNRHYEVFEYSVEIPAYTRNLKSFRRIDDLWTSDPAVPRLPSTETLYGWVFDCLFTDWPVYLPGLFRWYEQLGGRITIGEITASRLHEIDDGVLLVNCLGLGSRKLFEDRTPHLVVKGHLVKVSGAPRIRNDKGKTVSYNYNPAPDKYSDSEGNAQDLYCYPRADGLYIGGSRLEGSVGPDGRWRGTEPADERADIDGIQVPSPILELNGKILSESFGIELDDYTQRKAFIGYRYVRDRERGLRLEEDRFSGRRIFHNYGHGGAGVTLSWGCALHVARWMAESTGKTGADYRESGTFDSVSIALHDHLKRRLS